MTTNVSRDTGMLSPPRGRNAATPVRSLLAALLGLVSIPLHAAISYTVINPPSSPAGNSDDTAIFVAIDGENLIGSYYTAAGPVSGFVYTATTQALVNINPPGSGSTSPVAILGNNVVGAYENSTISPNGPEVEQGFLYNLTTQAYTTIFPPSAIDGECLGVSAQSIAGAYTDGSHVTHGFLYDLTAQTYTTIDPPGTVTTYATAISGNVAAGYYIDSSNVTHGFLYNGGAYTVIDPPGTTTTYVTAISGNVVAGYYEDSSNIPHGFLYNSATQTYTTVDPSGTTKTYIYGISGNDVVGSYDDSTFTSHGFLYDLGAQTYTTIDPPGSTFTVCHGISGNLIAGQYEDNASTSHYFIANLAGTTGGGGTGNSTAKVAITGLAATYNGASHAVTVTTSPAGLSTSVTYNGSATPPTAAGSYPVVATVTAAGYTGSASGTLVIAKAKATVTLSALSMAYNGAPQGATATTNPTGLAVALTYAGDSAEPQAAGAYAVVATITDPNYTGSAKGTFTITKAAATVMLGDLAATYDGLTHAATATTTPSGLNVTLTYNAKTTVPSAAASYKVIGTVDDPNYGGSATGTLVIAKATATVVVGNETGTYTGRAIAATATVTPAGLPVTFAYTLNGKAASPVTAGTYNVTATVNTANAAGSGTGTLTIAPATGTITLRSSHRGSLLHGKPIAVVATTVPARLAVGISYNGSATAPTAVGSYPVSATITNPDYSGSATGTLTITPVAPLATTLVASGVTSSGVTLGGSSDPRGSATLAWFQYGPTTAYGGISSMLNIGNGTAAVAFTLPVGGLGMGTTYHYRAVASSPGGTVYGLDKTFLTLGPGLPTAAQAYLAASGAQLSLSVNPNGVATKVYFIYSTSSDLSSPLLTATQNIGAGKVAVNVLAFLSGLEANTTYYYEAVITSAAGTFTSTEESFTTLGFDTTLVAATATLAPGTSFNWATLGNGAVDGSDGAAFRATLTGAAAASNTGIWANLGANVANSGTLSLVAQTGSSAPGISGAASGAVYSLLADPVYNDNGDVAFNGTLKIATGVVTAATENGVWASNSGTLGLLAREGSAAPGTGGALFATFTGVGLSDDAGAIVAGTLTASTALGVTAATNSGVWEGSTSNSLTLMLRTGESATGTATPRTISSFKLFPAETYVNGQTRAFGPASGHLAVTATYTDKTTGILEVVTPGAPALVATLGDFATDATGSLTAATFATFGSPAIDDSDEIAFHATLKVGVGGAVAANAGGIWSGYGAGVPARVGAARGDRAGHGHERDVHGLQRSGGEREWRGGVSRDAGRGRGAGDGGDRRGALVQQHGDAFAGGAGGRGGAGLRVGREAAGDHGAGA